MDYKLSLEYREVALRAEHVAASGLSRDEILIIIMGLEKAAEPVPTFMQARPFSSDPDDDMILDLAICGKASAIVTQNTKHFRIASRGFGIAVLTPAELLEVLGGTEV